jgi:uncharacterized protein YdbL (DUF1318 family)
MRKLILVVTMTFLVLTLACVTVNVYFPAAEVQNAADQIVDEIHGDTSTPSESSAVPHESLLRRALRGLALGERRAYAEADINVTTPNIRALKESMKKRFNSLVSLYDAGVIGEKNNGLLETRSLEGLDLKQKAEARKLIKDENSDRERLYLEIAEANNIPSDRVSDIGKLFANSWRKDAKDGWWIQKDNGEWVKKGAE